MHRWAIKLLPVLEKAFRRYKRTVSKSWRVDETYVKVRGTWKHLYRAVDKAGNTVDFLLRAKRNKQAAILLRHRTALINQMRGPARRARPHDCALARSVQTREA